MWQRRVVKVVVVVGRIRHGLRIRGESNANKTTPRLKWLQ